MGIYSLPLLSEDQYSVLDVNLVKALQSNGTKSQRCVPANDWWTESEDRKISDKATRLLASYLFQQKIWVNAKIMRGSSV